MGRRAVTPTLEASEIGVAALAQLHVVIGLRSVCGREIDPTDLNPDTGALRAWNRGVLPRCGKGIKSLGARRSTASAQATRPGASVRLVGRCVPHPRECERALRASRWRNAAPRRAGLPRRRRRPPRRHGADVETSPTNPYSSRRKDEKDSRHPRPADPSWPMSVIVGTAVERLIASLEDAGCQPRRCYAGWQSLCPAHEDRSPSLSVREGDDGRALVHCFVGCEVEAILPAVGLQLTDLFDDRSEPAWTAPPGLERRFRQDHCLACRELRAWEQRLHPTPAAAELAWTVKRWPAPQLAAPGVGWDGERFTFSIHDLDDKLVNVCRYVPHGQPKMRAIRGRPRDLFPSPESLRETLTLASGVREPVYLVEGEPDAVSALGAGLSAVAIPAARAGSRGFADRLAGLDVILTDHDEPGQRLAERAVRDLVGHAASVRVLRRPAVIGREPPLGYDVGDWLREHANERRAA